MVTEVVIKGEYLLPICKGVVTHMYIYIFTNMNTSCNLAYTLSHYLHIVLHVMLISVWNDTRCAIHCIKGNCITRMRNVDELTDYTAEL